MLMISFPYMNFTHDIILTFFSIYFNLFTTSMNLGRSLKKTNRTKQLLINNLNLRLTNIIY